MRITDVGCDDCLTWRQSWKDFAMRQLFALAAVAAAIACAALEQANTAPKENVVRAKMDLPAPAADPNLPFQVLKPLY
jgi:hypothetical protein